MLVDVPTYTVERKGMIVSLPDDRAARRTHAADLMPLADRWRFFRCHGSHTLAYSATVQGGLCHFENADGFVAFQRKMGHTFVLGDPIVDPSNLENLIDQFLSDHPNATFCQIGESTAKILDRRKYWVNEMGIDTRLDLPRYDFAGKEKERFRYAANWLARRNFRIAELEFTDAVIEQTKELCSHWRETRNVKRETAFLNRPIVLGSQPEMRRFFLLDEFDRMVAFVFFDPLFLANQLIGYVTAFKRRHPAAPSLAEQGICKQAIEAFRSEGLSVVRLGLSPFANVQESQFRHNWLLKWTFRYYFRASWVNRWFYNLQGHAEFKSRFRGVEESSYFASPTFMNDIRLCALLRLCKII